MLKSEGLIFIKIRSSKNIFKLYPPTFNTLRVEQGLVKVPRAAPSCKQAAKADHKQTQSSEYVGAATAYVAAPYVGRAKIRISKSN